MPSINYHAFKRKIEAFKRLLLSFNSLSLIVNIYIIKKQLSETGLYNFFIINAVSGFYIIEVFILNAGNQLRKSLWEGLEVKTVAFQSLGKFYII